MGPLAKDQVRSREKLLLTEKGESRGTCDETAVGVGADGVGEEVVRACRRKRRPVELVEELVEKVDRWWTPSVSALARLEDSEGSGSMGSRVWCPCAAVAELWLDATRVLASWHLLMGQI